jgi:hypothetical protein
MGYCTTFKGKLSFKHEATAKQLAELNKYLGADRRDLGYGPKIGVESDAQRRAFYQDGKYGQYWYHIDLALTEDYSGLEWSGADKTYDLEHIVNWLTDKMREQWPDFELEGRLQAQGEDMEDRWELVMEEGRAVKRELIVVGQRITCPHCEEDFILEEPTNDQ